MSVLKSWSCCNFYLWESASSVSLYRSCSHSQSVPNHFYTVQYYVYLPLPSVITANVSLSIQLKRYYLGNIPFIYPWGYVSVKTYNHDSNKFFMWLLLARCHRLLHLAALQICQLVSFKSVSPFDLVSRDFGTWALISQRNLAWTCRIARTEQFMRSNGCILE